MKKRRLKRISLLLLAIPACLLALAALVFFAASMWANSVRLPERLKKTPVALSIALSSPSRPFVGLVPVNYDEMLKLVQGGDYNDYLKLLLARNPKLESVAQYLQLQKRYEGENIGDNFRDFHGAANTIAHKPEVRAEFQNWMRVHAGFVDQVRRFAHAGPLPPFSVEEQQVYEKTGNQLRRANNTFYWQCIEILSSGAQLRFLENDLAGGRQYLEEGIILSGQYRGSNGTFSKILGSVLSSTPLSSIRAMVQSPDYTTGTMREIIPILEHAEKLLLPPDKTMRDLAEVYLDARQRIVARMEERSWRSPVFGWYFEDPLAEISDNNLSYAQMGENRFEVDLKLTENRHVTWPRLDRIAWNALTAIDNRLHATAALENFDRYYQDEIEAAKHSFSQLQFVGARWNTDRHYKSYMLTTGTLSTTNKRIIVLNNRLVALSHLTRLGAMYRVDPKAALARRTEDFTGHPDRPWRDPFTERPLMIDTASSPTLIWSLGPDLLDQHGAEQSDDISIRVPR